MIKKLTALALLIISLQPTFSQSVTIDHSDSISVGEHIAYKAVQIGTGAVATIGLTELCKAVVNETRPNAANNQSFPSRHTSWAWAGASVIANELYWHSPWWVSGAHAIANGVAFQRVLSRNHWVGDVLAGGALGLGSMELGYWVGNLFFPELKRAIPHAANHQSSYFSISTETLIPINQPKGNLHWRTGIGSHISLSLPVNDNFSFRSSILMQVRQMVQNKKFYDHSTAAGLALGSSFRHGMSYRWAAEYNIEVGVLKNFRTINGLLNNIAFTGGVDAGCSYSVTSNLKLAATVGYHLTTIINASQTIVLGFQTRSCF